MQKTFNGQKELAKTIQNIVDKAKEQNTTLIFEVLMDDVPIIKNYTVNPHDVKVNLSDSTLFICGMEIPLGYFEFGQPEWKRWQGWQANPDELYFYNPYLTDVLYNLQIDDF